MDEVTGGPTPPHSDAVDLDTPMNDMAGPAPSETSFEDEDKAMLEFLRRHYDTTQHATSQDTTQNSSPFFGVLPREIRDQIYREVSAHDPHCFNSEAMSELFARMRQRRRAGHSEVCLLRDDHWQN